MAAANQSVLPNTGSTHSPVTTYSASDLLDADRALARSAAEYLKQMPNQNAVVTGAFYDAFEGKREDVMELLVEFELVSPDMFDYTGDPSRFNRDWMESWYVASLDEALNSGNGGKANFLLGAKNCFTQSIANFGDRFSYGGVQELNQRGLLEPEQLVRLLKNVYINTLKATIPEAPDQQNCFYSLFIEAANVCIVLLQKSPFNNFPFYGSQHHSEFNNMRFYTDVTSRYQIPNGITDELSLNAVGILLFPSQDPDTGTIDSLWNKETYIVGRLAIRILPNSFIPSPELRSGFSYRYEAIVVRGHERHLSGETSALAELRGQLEDLLLEARKITIPKGVNADARKKVERAHSKLGRIKSILAKHQFNPDRLGEEVGNELDTLFKITEQIAYLRLYEVNSQVEGDIQKEKSKAKELIDGKLTNLVTQGYFSEAVTQKDREELIQGDFYQELLEVVSAISLEASQAQRKAELQQVWRARIKELKKVIIEDQVTTAHGPIVRIYQEVKVETPEKLLEACTHLSSSIVNIPNYVNPSLYLQDSGYRKQLLGFLRKLHTFYKNLTVTLPMNINLGRLDRDISDLKGIDSYWDQLSQIDHSQLHLSSIGLVGRELSQRFEQRLTQNLGTLSYHLFDQGPPDFRSALKGKAEEVLSFIFEKIDLIDRELELGGGITRNGNSLRYMDPYYSQQRMQFDSQLFLTMVGYLQSETIQNPTTLIGLISNRLCLLKKTERTYGPSEKKLIISHPLNDFGQLLDKSITTLNQIIEAMDPFDSTAANELKKSKDLLEKKSGEIGSLGKNILAMFDASSIDTDWWKEFKNHTGAQQILLNEVQLLFTHIQGVLNNHIQVDLNTFDTAYQQKKQNLLPVLEKVRSLLSQKSTLCKEVNALLQIAQRNVESGGVNRGIIQAKENVSDIKSKLVNLKKGTTPYDLLLRDDAIEKLTHVEVALTSDPTSEFYIRMRELKKSIEKEYQDNPNIVFSLQGKINALPNKDEFPKLDPDALEVGLKVLYEKLKTLPEELKKDLLILELQHAKNLMAEMEKNMAYYYCKKWGDDLNRQLEGVNFSLIRREWVNSRQKVVSSYSWSKSPVNKDPYFSANETHVRI
ncbi:MAG: hypothetical protein KDK76_06215 [Chlamydiia bacterium]|nr:hypothetical protein [Chlamydiia bacterium]